MKTIIPGDSPIVINPSGGMFTQIPGGSVVEINKHGASSVVPGFDFTQESYANFVGTASPATGLYATGCTVEDLGLCSDGSNHIYGLRLGACDGSKPIIMLVGSMHGSEWQNSYIMRKFMTYLANPSGPSAAYFSILKNTYDFYAIPLANPYGYINTVGCIATQVGGKYVDPNRNYDFYWSSYNDTGDTYSKGSAPESAPETLAVATKLRALMPIVLIEGHLQTGTGITVYETPITNTGYWADINAKLVSYGMPCTIYNNSNYTLPFLGNYSRTVLNTNINRHVNSIIYELGGSNTSIQDSNYALTFILQGCLYIDNWKNSQYLETITIRPIGDTCIRSNVGTTNYGIYPESWVGMYGTTFTGRMLIKFDTTRIPLGSTIDSASVNLYCLNAYVSVYNDMSLYRSLVTWYEGVSNGAEPGAGVDASVWNYKNYNGSVAWGAAGGQSGVDYYATPSATATIVKTAWNAWNVKVDMQGISNGTITDYGYFLIGDEVHTSSAHDFANREYTTASQRPYLSIVLK
jgi:hypothetical protein